ncbi:glycosyltransferase family 2 protein [Actinoplanes sp. NPDC051851]|uniref:glycosyltransferase family 2 protein n=1 Tax=Actinoplanes sp. NPDC051851 TaxID=3154753 RepID=UPI0034469274
MAVNRPVSPTVSIVIPAGTAALPVLVSTLPAVAEVIVVVGRDDDTTRAVPRAARVIRQTRSGLGNALACGVAASTGDVVVTMPGDGSCDPAEVPRLVKALREGADVAQGSRYRVGGRNLGGGGFARVADRIVLWFMSVLFGCRRTDPGFGLRAFWRDSAAAVGLPRVAGHEPCRGDGPEIEPLLTVRAGENGLFVTEVPATAYPGGGSPGLATSLRVLFGEYLVMRRAAAAPPPESIVVMTGRTRAVAPVVEIGFHQEAPQRRQWRDNRFDIPERRMPSRPNLRVIQGEGATGQTRSGQTGSGQQRSSQPRSGHLRSVR